MICHFSIEVLFTSRSHLSVLSFHLHVIYQSFWVKEKPEKYWVHNHHGHQLLLVMCLGKMGLDPSRTMAYSDFEEADWPLPRESSSPTESDNITLARSFFLRVGRGCFPAERHGCVHLIFKYLCEYIYNWEHCLKQITEEICTVVKTTVCVF